MTKCVELNPQNVYFFIQGVRIKHYPNQTKRGCTFIPSIGNSMAITDNMIFKEGVCLIFTITNP